MSEMCFQCGKELEPDEIAIYKKLVNRGARKYLCVPCLSRYFGVEESLIREKIRYFREQGCTLFTIR